MASILSLAQAVVDVCASHPVLTSFLLLVAFVAASRDRNPIRYPTNLPLVWEKAGTKQFSLRTRLAFHTDCARLFRDAYEHVSCHSELWDRACITYHWIVLAKGPDRAIARARV